MDKPATPTPAPADDDLRMAETPAAPVKLPPRFPDMPWKKKTANPSTQEDPATPKTPPQPPANP